MATQQLRPPQTPTNEEYTLPANDLWFKGIDTNTTTTTAWRSLERDLHSPTMQITIKVLFEVGVVTAVTH